MILFLMYFLKLLLNYKNLFKIFKFKINIFFFNSYHIYFYKIVGLYYSYIQYKFSKNYIYFKNYKNKLLGFHQIYHYFSKYMVLGSLFNFKKFFFFWLKRINKFNKFKCVYNNFYNSHNSHNYMYRLNIILKLNFIIILHKKLKYTNLQFCHLNNFISKKLIYNLNFFYFKYYLYLFLQKYLIMRMGNFELLFNYHINLNSFNISYISSLPLTNVLCIYHQVNFGNNRLYYWQLIKNNKFNSNSILVFKINKLLGSLIINYKFLFNFNNTINNFISYKNLLELFFIYKKKNNNFDYFLIHKKLSILEFKNSINSIYISNLFLIFKTKIKVIIFNLILKRIKKSLYYANIWNYRLFILKINAFFQFNNKYKKKNSFAKPLFFNRVKKLVLSLIAILKIVIKIRNILYRQFLKAPAYFKFYIMIIIQKYNFYFVSYLYFYYKFKLKLLKKKYKNKYLLIEKKYSLQNFINKLISESFKFFRNKLCALSHLLLNNFNTSKFFKKIILKYSISLLILYSFKQYISIVYNLITYTHLNKFKYRYQPNGGFIIKNIDSHIANKLFYNSQQTYSINKNIKSKLVHSILIYKYIWYINFFFRYPLFSIYINTISKNYELLYYNIYRLVNFYSYYNLFFFKSIQLYKKQIYKDIIKNLIVFKNKNFISYKPFMFFYKKLEYTSNTPLFLYSRNFFKKNKYWQLMFYRYNFNFVSYYVNKQFISRLAYTYKNQIKLKPGYLRIWRGLRYEFKILYNIKSKYQFKLTRYISKIKNLLNFEIFQHNQLNLINIIHISKIIYIKKDIYSLIVNGIININGITIFNSSYQLMINDHIQFKFSYQILIYLKLKNSSALYSYNHMYIKYFIKRLGFKAYLLKKKNIVTSAFFNLFSLFNYTSIYLNIDFYTLSILIIKNLFLSFNNVYHSLLYYYPYLKILNWKYLI